MHEYCAERIYYLFIHEQGASTLNLLITNYELRITNYSVNN